MKLDGMSNWADVTPPAIALPLNGSFIVAALGFTITLMPIIKAIDLTHTSTDYEVRTAPNGGGAVTWSSMADTSALQLKIVPALTLAAGQTYYTRARFNTAGPSSAWSADTVVTT